MRRTFSDLFTKGIIENRTVFGNSLVKLQEQSQRDVPQFVKKSIEEIEHYLNEPMIYGTSGNLAEIQKIRMEIDNCNIDIIDKTKDVYILAGALKLFFRYIYIQFHRFFVGQNEVSGSLRKDKANIGAIQKLR